MSPPPETWPTRKIGSPPHLSRVVCTDTTTPNWRTSAANFAADVRQFGVVVSVHTTRDRCGGEPIFRVGHVSGGGDIAFLSLPMMLEDHAAAAARVLAEFVDAREVKLAP